MVEASEAPGMNKASTTMLDLAEDGTARHNERGGGGHLRQVGGGKGRLFVLLGVVAGIAAAALILIFGLSAARKQEQVRFDRIADDLLQQFQQGFEKYLLTAMWVHQSGLHLDLQQEDQDVSRPYEDFRVMFEYMNSTGILLDSIALVRNVSHAERQAHENATRTYLQRKFSQRGNLDLGDNSTSLSDIANPGMTGQTAPYIGFFDLAFNQDLLQVLPRPRPPQPWYMPIRYVEPFENPLALGSMDLDVYSIPQQRQAIDVAVATGKPALTARFELDVVSDAADFFFVVLFHPGIPLVNVKNDKKDNGGTPPPPPRDFTLFPVPIPGLLEQTRLEGTSEQDRMSIFIFDSTEKVENPDFLGGGTFNRNYHIQQLGPVTFAKQQNLTTVLQMEGRYKRVEAIQAASRQWTIVVMSMEDSFEPDIAFIVAGAVLIFLVLLCLTLWKLSDDRRAAHLEQVQTKARTEKTTLVLENANRTAQRERQLNDFVAHEVRNPLAAAMSACSFVKSGLQKDTSMDENERTAIQEDVEIIGRSLQFINDLLRSMLDMHRASSNQLKLELVPTDIMHDILRPTAAMLYQRGSGFEVLVECPENLIVMADRIRLKQIILNLGRNSVKFVQKGFIRLGAGVENGRLVMTVSDSGPGIPLQKRGSLFAKFQDALDNLNQGTGIGLHLCKSLSALMGGDVWLDDEYDSGIPGSPGTKFVISIAAEPVATEQLVDIAASDMVLASSTSNKGPETVACDPSEDFALQETMRVLFVDDDLILRKLFSRSLRNLFPKWRVDEAANGETALRLTTGSKKDTYDCIFLDMYLSSVDKQLTGTETARALRSQGVASILCGLSANDMEGPFLSAGADCFLSKPFPVDEVCVRRELRRILNSRRQ